MLEVLGDGRLSTREIAERVSERLGQTKIEADPAVSALNVRTVAMRMLAAGQLEREATGTFRGRTGIWQWHRKQGLYGPIAELERAFEASDGEAVA